MIKGDDNMGRGDSGWFGESRRHALSQKGIETKASGKTFQRSGYSTYGQKKEIFSEELEMPEGVYRLTVFSDRRWVLETPRGVPEEGQFDEKGFSFRAKVRERIEDGKVGEVGEWILNVGESLSKKNWVTSGRINTDQGAIDFLSKKPLTDLRRRQDLVNAMIKTASERRMNESLAKLQIREWHLQQAILKREWPEDYQFDYPNHILELKKILGIKKDELGDLD